MVVTRSVVLLCPLVLLTLTGCGDEFAGREAISGTVTLKGEPLKTGSIQFDPLDNQDSTSGGGIVDGKFTIERKSGLKPGKYLVRITSGDGKTPASEPEGGDAPGPGGPANILSFDIIPPDWAEASKQQVEVKAGQKNEFKFEIPNTRDKRRKR